MRLIEGIEYGIHHMAAAGQCSWYEFAREIFEQAKVECKVLSITTEEFGRPAPRPAFSALTSQREHAIRLPSWQDGLAGYLAQRRSGGELAMKLLVTGAAGFIGSTYVRHRRRRARDRRARQAHLRRAGRENLPEGIELIEGAIEDPAIVREAMQGVDAVVNFAAESHVDRSIDDQDAFARTHVIGTGTLLDAARELGVERYLQVSTDEVYGSIESGSFTETSPLDPSSPYSATKAAGDLLVSAHVHTYGIDASIVRGSNNYGPRQYPEKLIPLMVLNALHGDSLPVYGDGKQVRNWLYVEDFCRGIHTVLTKGKRRRGLQRRRPRRVREHRGRQAGDRADRRRRVADRVRQRPPRPRPPLLALLREAEATSSAGRRRSTSPRASRRPSHWYRDNEEWWGPIRSGEYREYYEKQYGKASASGRAAARPSSTASSCSSPPSTATSAASCVETYSRDAWARARRRRRVRPAQPLALRARARCAGSTSRPSRARRSWSAAPRGAILDVAVDLRRGSPTYGQWEAPRARRREATASSSSRSASATASPCSATSPTSPTCVSSVYDPATEAGIAWDDPDVGVDWQVDEPLLSERDKTAPKLSEIADSLPW